MKTELKLKFLQHLTQKKKDAGFTLIELLVVIIIIGILSAIALPSFLNQAAKARQSEAKTNVGAMNRAQQTYYLENQAFTNSIATLGVGIKDTQNYSYVANTVTALADNVANKATANNSDLKGYVGGVFKTGGNTDSILCENSTAGLTAPNNPTTATQCGANSVQLK